MKNYFLRVLFCFLLSFPFFILESHASHMIGGDISYRCLGNNQFEITITLYQDCLDGEPDAITFDNPAYYSIYTAGPNPQLYKAGEVNYTEKTLTDPNFNNECINNFPRTCMQMQVFKFIETLSPNAEGYHIIYQRCCRNASISNIQNPGNVGVTYLATIPGFQNGECPNNSALFKELPPQIICANNPFVYDFSAIDMDGDSLSYELCDAKPGGTPFDSKPYGNGITPPPHPSVNYFPPYSPTYPVSGIPPLAINPITGIMTGTPNTMGRFVVTVCVKEWRNGELINQFWRDIQFVITNCSKAVIAGIPELEDQPNVFKVQCQGYTVDFENTSSGGFKYLWDFGVPGATSTEFEPSFTYPDTGTYRVKLIVNEGSTCADSITRLVKVYPEFKSDFSWEGNLCPGEEIQFMDNSISAHGNINSWYWNFGDGIESTERNPKHTFLPPGGNKEVTFISTSDIGCSDTAKVTFPMTYIDVFAGNDTVIVKDYFFKLNGQGAQYYAWQPADYLSDPNIADPEVNFPGTGSFKYVLFGRNDEGCEGQDTINIQVVDKGIIFVPNAFSPNNDGVNDGIRPYTVGYTLINNFSIYNRYGQTVFSATNQNEPEWDGTYNGKPAELGVYFWSITVTDLSGERITETGDITLMR